MERELSPLSRLKKADLSSMMRAFTVCEQRILFSCNEGSLAARRDGVRARFRRCDRQEIRQLLYFLASPRPSRRFAYGETGREGRKGRDG